MFWPAEQEEAEGGRGCSGQHEAAGGGALSLRHAVQNAGAARSRPRRHEGAARHCAVEAAAENGVDLPGSQ